jgi:short-subunit dehydrogenase
MKDKKYYTLITGACGGLGRAFVKLLAQKKENLILVGTSEKKLSDLLEEFKTQFDGLSVKTMVCDLSKRKSREALIDQVNEHGLIVDKLINNAGAIVEGDLLRFSNEEIEKAIQVNCIGTLELTRMFFEIRDPEKKFEVLTVSS